MYGMTGLALTVLSHNEFCRAMGAEAAKLYSCDRFPFCVNSSALVEEPPQYLMSTEVNIFVADVSVPYLCSVLHGFWHPLLSDRSRRGLVSSVSAY